MLPHTDTDRHLSQRDPVVGVSERGREVHRADHNRGLLNNEARSVRRASRTTERHDSGVRRSHVHSTVSRVVVGIADDDSREDTNRRSTGTIRRNSTDNAELLKMRKDLLLTIVPSKHARDGKDFTISNRASRTKTREVNRLGEVATVGSRRLRDRIVGYVLVRTGNRTVGTSTRSDRRKLAA
jgi:hypothetical protein